MRNKNFYRELLFFSIVFWLVVSFVCMMMSFQIVEHGAIDFNGHSIRENPVNLLIGSWFGLAVAGNGALELETLDDV